MNPPPTTLKIARYGFNLIESAIVLGVVGLVVGGIWAATATLYDNYKISKTTEGLMTIVLSTQKLISNRDAIEMGDTYGLASLLKKAGAIPEDWIHNNRIISPYGYGLSTIQNQLNAGTPELYIVLNAVPKSSCPKLLMKITNIGTTSDNTTASRVGNSTLAQAEVNWPNWTTRTFPLSLETAQTACDQDANRLGFKFGYPRTN